MLELMQQPKRRKKKMNENCMDSTHCLLEIRTQYIRTNVLAVPPGEADCREQQSQWPDPRLLLCQSSLVVSTNHMSG